MWCNLSAHYPHQLRPWKVLLSAPCSYAVEKILQLSKINQEKCVKFEISENVEVAVLQITGFVVNNCVYFLWTLSSISPDAEIATKLERFQWCQCADLMLVYCTCVISITLWGSQQHPIDKYRYPDKSPSSQAPRLKHPSANHFHTHFQVAVRVSGHSHHEIWMNARM